MPPEAGASLRYRVLMWMAHHLLGEGATPEDLARDVPTGEVFKEPAAGVPTDLNRAMEALCRFVGEDPPHRFALFGRLHPALLLHWRVQAHLVSRLGPDLRRAYRELWSNETVSGHPLSQYGMFRLLPPPPPAPCHEDWDAPDPQSWGASAWRSPRTMTPLPLQRASDRRSPRTMKPLPLERASDGRRPK